MSSAEEAGIEREACRRQTDLVYRSSGVVLGVTVLSATLLAAVNAALHTPVAQACTWWLLILTLTGVRALLALLRSRDPARDQRIELWRRVWLAGVMAAALTWGSGTVLFMWHAPQGARLFTALVLAGMVAGAVPTLAPVATGFRLFAHLTLIPTAVLIFVQAQELLDWAFGFMSVVFLIAVQASARQLHQSLTAATRLGLEQAQLAATVSASEERYRLILQYSPAGIVHYNPDGVITFCNERMAQMMGTDRSRLIGLDLNTLTDRRVMPALEAALAGRDGRYEGEYLSTLSGQRIWVSMSCTALRGADGGCRGAIAIVQDITERHRSEEEIRQLAYYDPLTRLPNRRLTLDRLSHALSTSGRARQYGALMILDLDRFARINESQGHETGDALLVEAARRLNSVISRDGMVARLGADEFVVIVEALGENEGSAAAASESIAARLQETLALPYNLGGGDSACFSSACIGVTLFRGQEESAELVLKQADVAVHQAKESGSNCIRYFNTAMQAAIDRRSALESALRRGFERGEFVLHYQPQVQLDGRTSGAEAMLRWISPDRGVVMPAQFIPLAEESGLIVPLGRRVLEMACARLKAWEGQPGLESLRLSVNVSARQFHEPAFVASVCAALLHSGANPALLNLELTESVVLTDVEAVVRRMDELHALGVSFSMDDFGRGYSSLAYLKRLPLDTVKIDRAFIDGLPGDSSDAAIVRAILAMSRSLGLHVIAEGVELGPQRDFLERHGCTTFQGFLFARPLPVEEFERYVTAVHQDQPAPAQVEAGLAAGRTGRLERSQG